MKAEKVKIRKILENRENRIRIAAIVIAFFYAIILLKIAFIYAESEDSTRSFKSGGAPYKKHNILDANGALLATSINTYNFYILPSKTVFPEETADKIATLFPSALDSSEIFEKIKYKKNKRALIKKEITAEQKDKIIAAGIEGAEFEKSYSRVYPYGNVFSHVIGYVNGNLEGVYGLERSLNSELYYRDVETTLDARIQVILHNMLSSTFAEYNANAAFGIIANIKTGGVVSLVSLPDFNPKKIDDTSSVKMINTPTSSVYHLGSVFKIITIAMAIENGVNPEQTFNVNQRIQVDKSFILKDDYIRKPNLKASEILAYSSNVGSVLMLEAVTLPAQRLFFEQIGVFTVPKLELSPYEIAPPIFKSGKWPKSVHYTATYGYGIAISPIHFAEVVSTIIGGGNKINFTLLKSKVENQSKGKRIVSDKTSKIMQLMLRDVIKIGTAKLAAVNGYEICGKTSTSLKYDIKLKSWSKQRKMVSFIAFFPCAEPKYLIYIGLDEPKKTEKDRYLQGGTVVAPLAANIISEIAPLLNIKPDERK